ncbi:MAG: hypothetical protein PHY09_08995 [Desulfuromonadaceae bacterium]|nr:hypothetical protein [Desulfuromonadaceae bacterium]MDD5107724.1 hypothetical protein [Desulfuromonadaceae bacterium]
MVLGFNHNITYKSEIFHVQTEDSGVDNPHIITLLYRGGVIICSQKTDYSDILKTDNLETVVEELMKEQHKLMMRRLKAGEFDEKAFSFKAQLLENYEIPVLEPLAETAHESAPFPSQQIEADTTSLQSYGLLVPLMGDTPVAQKNENVPPEVGKKVENLDEAILSFFGAREK